MRPKRIVAALLTFLLWSGIISPVEARTTRTCFGRHATINGTQQDDVLRGTKKDDVIISGSGQDRIFGAGGADLICAGKGNDRIQDGEDALGARDFFRGGSGNDEISMSGGGRDLLHGWILGISGVAFGGSGNDTLNAGFASAKIYGGPGEDHLVGSHGGDRLDGGAGNDNLRGEDGPDLLISGGGTDSVDGGPNESGNNVFPPDTITFAESTDPAFVNAAPDNEPFDLIAGVERIIGSEFDDYIIGTHIAETIVGGEGSDLIQSGDGNDRLEGEAGNDTSQGDAGKDILVDAAGDDVLDGGDGTDRLSFDDDAVSVGVTVNLSAGIGEGSGLNRIAAIEDLRGSDKNDELAGDSGPNRLWGGPGDDEVLGNAEADVLDGGPGRDSIDGGEGVDSVSFIESEQAVIVDLATRVASDGSGDEAILGVESVLGSHFDDRIIGTDVEEKLVGAKGADYIDGRGGADSIWGGGSLTTEEVGLANEPCQETDLIYIYTLPDGDDTIVGGSGDDVLHGDIRLTDWHCSSYNLRYQDGDDEITGGDDNDAIIGHGGDDFIDGGDGIDEADGAEGADDCTAETERNCETVLYGTLEITDHGLLASDAGDAYSASDESLVRVWDDDTDEMKFSVSSSRSFELRWPTLPADACSKESIIRIDGSDWFTARGGRANAYISCQSRDTENSYSIWFGRDERNQGGCVEVLHLSNDTWRFTSGDWCYASISAYLPGRWQEHDSSNENPAFELTLELQS